MYLKLIIHCLFVIEHCNKYLQAKGQNVFKNLFSYSYKNVVFLFFADILFTGVDVEFLAPSELERCWSEEEKKISNKFECVDSTEV